MFACESNAKTYARKFPKMFTKGNGCYLFDDENNRYIDCLACAGALPLGNNHPIVKQAISDYLNSELPQQMLDLSTPAKAEYIEEIFEWFPNEMRNYKIHFCSPSGSDAVEASLKLCRSATKRQNIISFSGCYHGQTNGSLSLMGNLNSKTQTNLPLLNTIIFPYPNNFHYEFSAENILNLLNQTLEDDESGLLKPAGIILECIQGEGGVCNPGFNFIKGIRNICTKFNIPMIVDEVQSGFFRTGKKFAFNHSDIIPDVVVCAKSAGGSQPLAFIIYKPELDTWTSGAHTGTFRGSQLSFVTGKYVLNYLRLNDYDYKVNLIGSYFVEKLNMLKNSFPQHIYEVRGLGLMLGLQLYTNLKPDGDKAKIIQSKLFNQFRIILELGGRSSSVLRFLTSYDITPDIIDTIIESLSICFDEL